jgi:hypothetical protein
MRATLAQARKAEQQGQAEEANGQRLIRYGNQAQKLPSFTG